MNEFVHLHVHTEYSLLDGFARVDKLVETVKELGMDSVAITDHGSMFGIVEFYKKAKKAGVKPILGCEVYVAVNNLEDRDNKDKNQYHLVLLAETEEGYKNLMKLVSIGYVDGFYYKPRVDKQALREHSKGLIALSACLAGEVSQKIMNEDYDSAKASAEEYNDIFGSGNYFLEIQDYGIERQRQVNEEIIKIASETNIPLIATNDVHYLRKEDSYVHDVLLCVQTQTTINEEKRMKFPTNEFYLKSPEEMAEIFRKTPEAISNSVKIAERCNVELHFGDYHLPRFYAPDGIDNKLYLRELVEKGLVERYGEITTEIKERYEYELKTISDMGFVDYFLIVMDFILYAKNKDIPVGPGRGSAAGSIVSYALHITDIDPLEYALLFERFLNPERISMPDIDVDFCYERRDEVIDYVIEKYGSENVAQIVTFGTMLARGAIRDIARALEIPYGKADYVAKLIPMSLGMTIEKALNISDAFRKEYETDDEVKWIVDIAKSVEGLPRHTSTHAAGVVISELPVTEYVPLVRTKDSIATQFNMIELEELGLLKMDFLGLRTLTVIKDTVDLIYKNHGIKIDVNNLNPTDEKVFKMFQNAETLGIFQFESSGMRSFLKELKPTSIEDLVAANSLYRPGPMSQIPKFVEGKHNPSSITYIHPKLEKILCVTYGCIVYQEQVLEIVRDIGGYSLGRADLVRRAMSKKKMDVMEEERKNFIYGKVDEDGNVIIAGAIRNGVDENSANKIYDLMIDFANYAFNKSHSAAYAVVAYQTAYLKEYYPVEFMASQITSIMGSTSQIALYMRECSRLEIEVLPPSVNRSYGKFTVANGKIHFGLSGVKNVGQGLISVIVKAREQGEFTDIVDFLTKIDRVDKTALNKRAIESLIKAGALDDFGRRRTELLGVFELLIESIHDTNRRNLEGQFSMFGGESTEITVDYPNTREFPKELLLQMEKEMMGIYVSGHPLDPYKEAYERRSEYTTMELNRLSSVSSDGEDGNEENAVNIRDGAFVSVGGIITHIRTMNTKTNKLMAFIKLEDFYGEIECVIFPNTYTKYIELLREDSGVLIRGKVSYSEVEGTKILADSIYPLSEEHTNKGKLYLRVPDADSETLEKINDVLLEMSGDTEVIICTDKKTAFKAKNAVNAEKNTINRIKLLLGEENVILK